MSVTKRELVTRLRRVERLKKELEMDIVVQSLDGIDQTKNKRLMKFYMSYIKLLQLEIGEL